MSNVIHLEFTHRNRSTSALPEGASAEIVIFHGVRVERLTDEMIQQSAPRSNRWLPAMSNQAIAADLDEQYPSIE